MYLIIPWLTVIVIFQCCDESPLGPYILKKTSRIRLIRAWTAHILGGCAGKVVLQPAPRGSSFSCPALICRGPFQPRSCMAWLFNSSAWFSSVSVVHRVVQRIDASGPAGTWWLSQSLTFALYDVRYSVASTQICKSPAYLSCNCDWWLSMADITIIAPGWLVAATWSTIHGFEHP